MVDKIDNFKYLGSFEQKNSGFDDNFKQDGSSEKKRQVFMQ